MGIDAVIYTNYKASDLEINKANLFIKNRDWPFLGVKEPIVRRGSIYGGPELVVFDTGYARYYSEFYRHGPWPEIASALMIAKAVFPKSAPIFYQDDVAFYEDLSAPTEATDQFIERTWKIYLSKGGVNEEVD